MADYQANEVAADIIYKGKWVEVEGVADHIGKDILNTMYVTLKGAKEFDIFSVQCFFAKGYESTLAQVKPGYIYKIRGVCEGKFGNVMIKKCTFELAADVLAEDRAERATLARAAREAQLAVEEAHRKERAEANRPQAAASMLKSAKQFASMGDEAGYKAWLHKVIEKYPETKSAAEARDVLGLSPATPDVRSWTDKSGKHTIQAQLIDNKDGKVSLKKTDGKVVKVPIANLSDNDQQFIRSNGR